MITYAGMSKEGGRAVNEDYIGNAEKNGVRLFCLADGLGGHGGGDIASSLSVKTSLETFNSADTGDIPTVLARCFQNAQDNVLREQLNQNKADAMKTTLVLLAVAENTAFYGHIGDSRLYLFRKSKYEKRTLDHSVPQMLVASGEIKEEQIRYHEDRNRLIRVIGTEWPSPRYDLAPACPLKRGDAFLLATDGFWELVDEKTMSKRLKSAKTAGDWLEQMEKDIIKNGIGKNMDNYSAISIFVG